MLKKLICYFAGILLAVIELVILGVSPMTVLGTIVLVSGFVGLAMALYADYVADKKVTVTMIVAYSAGALAVGFAGAAFTLNNMILLVIAGVFLVVGVCAVLIEKKMKKA